MSVRIALSKHKSPSVPIVSLDLIAPGGSETVSGVAGIVDTAADCTVIPIAYLHQLKLRPVRQVRAQGFGTSLFLVDVYRVRVVIPSVCDLTVDAIEHAKESYILLGRDVLKQLRFTFDGPNEFIEFL